uniref:Anoctamin n=2 Tax=Culicoides sonorensis TaxID=179676 RepID=A0A336KEP0_CULSO
MVNFSLEFLILTVVSAQSHIFYSSSAVNTSKFFVANMADSSGDESSEIEDLYSESPGKPEMLIRNRHDKFSEKRPLIQFKGSDFPETALVIEFSKDTDFKGLVFLVDKIRSNTIDGGAELLIAMEPNKDHLILHVSATNERLFQLADEVALMKRSKRGDMMIFSVAALSDFWDPKMDINSILTFAERQFLVKHALDSIKPFNDETCVPGYAKIKLDQTRPLIQTYIKEGLITDFYSLHDVEYLKLLTVDWYKPYRKQPLDKIRYYFGESIGMYFGFLGFYSRSLILPAVLGVVQYIFSYEMLPFLCAFYLIWIILFLELWKRKSSTFAYRWGTISLATLDVPRSGFEGELGPDPVTGRMTPQYPYWKTLRQIYCVSVPVIILCLIAASTITISQFWVEDILIELYGPESYITLIPSICNSIWIALLPLAYSKFANFLTDLENHRTQAQYDRHRVNKLIVIEFVNNFLSLFYVAFVRQDLKLLKTYLLCQLLIVQFVQNFIEILWPIIDNKIRKRFTKEDTQAESDKNNDYNALNLPELEGDDPRIKQRAKESKMDAYLSTYEDYLELYIQFGYVVLFAAVSPLTALLALLNNILEIRIDAFKLCKAYRRPFARRVKNIGAWQLAFESLAVISIMTNCGVMYLSPSTQDWRERNGVEKSLLIFFIVEHLLLLAVWFIHKFVPDKPRSIRLALAKSDYESRQALKREVQQSLKHD